MLQFFAVCCDTNNTNQVPSNFVLQQLLYHRRDVARYRAREFAVAADDAALAATVPLPGQQQKSDMRPFTERFPEPIEVAIDAFNRLVGYFNSISLIYL